MNYESKNGNNYKINFTINKERINIEFQKENINDLNEEEHSKEDEVYNSGYDLKFINSNLFKIKNFSNIVQFKNCLINNINYKKLIILDIYDDAIYTYWNIFPEDDEQNISFTLIIEKKVSKNLSLIFYAKNKDAEFIIKALRRFDISKYKVTKNANFLLQQYDNKFIENMIFLESLNIKNYIQIIKNNFKKGKKYRTVLFFIDKDIDLIKTIFSIINEEEDELIMNHIFIIIYTEKNISELKLKLENKINELNKELKCYFDINNIFIFGKFGINKLFLSLIKIYNYYNQIGDGYLKESISLINNNELKKNLII